MKIAILGKAGSGKDTLADYFVNKHGFKKISFAMGLKNVANGLYLKKHKDREFLQKLGKALKEVDKDVFIKYTLSKEVENTVISDVRYPEEYLELTRRGYMMIRMEVPLVERLKRIEKRDKIEVDGDYLKTLLDESETLLDNKEIYWANNIQNTQDISTLYKVMDDIYDNIDEVYKKSLQRQQEAMKKFTSKPFN